jgi:hypothetical protein
MIYEILDDKGKVINRINADLEFVTKNYPGKFKDVTPPPVVESRRKQLTRYEFRALFTFAEQVAITTAAKADVAVEVFMTSMGVAEVIDLDYPETAQGLGYLVKLGLIKQEKMDDILKGF